MNDLSCVSANMDESTVASLPDSLMNGVYYGYASIDNGSVHKMVMSIGRNPHYLNEKRSMVMVIS
jgi:riboflavin kinase